MTTDKQKTYAIKVYCTIPLVKVEVVEGASGEAEAFTIAENRVLDKYPDCSLLECEVVDEWTEEPKRRSRK